MEELEYQQAGSYGMLLAMRGHMYQALVNSYRIEPFKTTGRGKELHARYLHAEAKKNLWHA